VPIALRVLPARGLVLIRYTGVAGIDETVAALSQHLGDPAFMACRRHLVDLRDVRDFDRDFPRFFGLQARMAEILPPAGEELRVVFVAPTAVAQAMAGRVTRSWDGQTVIPVRVFEDMRTALDNLGLDDLDPDAAAPADGPDSQGDGTDLPATR
jgi:hypothetical protein